MSIRDFLNEQKEKLDQTVFNVEQWSLKCRELLRQIKPLDESRFSVLSSLFSQYFSKSHVQKKKVVGFYGQLVAELAKLQAKHGKKLLEKSSEKVIEAVKAGVTHAEEAYKEIKKEVKKISKEVTAETKSKKKVVKKAEAPKTTKKVAKKVTKKK